MTSDQGRPSRIAGRLDEVGRDAKGRLFDLARGADRNSLSVSGSDQAREGRLVDALAARGDEGRDTLR